MIDELRERIRAQYKPGFDFTPVADVPFTAPSKPPSRIALISTAGLHLPEQEPFDRTSVSGDCSYRRICSDDDLARLHIGWDVERRQPASQDVNSAFPLALLREVRELAPVHYSFSGAIPDPRPLIEHTAPALAEELDADAVVIAPS
jgi:D-proline reductase (dithiol) PrdB